MADAFDRWLAEWWPSWQRRHARGVSETIDPDERAALREAYEAGRLDADTLRQAHLAKMRRLYGAG